MASDSMSEQHTIERLWREHDLPEYFLGNGGSNTKLYALYNAIVEECAKIAADRAVRLRAKAKAQKMPSRQSYFAQSIEARVIADSILAQIKVEFAPAPPSPIGGEQP